MTVLRIAVTGSKGRIGRYLLSRGCVPLDCDITDPVKLSAAIFTEKPTVIINCAGVSDVEYAQNNYKESTITNVRGFYNVCNAAANYGAMVVGLSSDHVFSGKLWYPFTYNEQSKPSPVNSYGWTKWGMEQVAKTFFNAYVVRTSFAFDAPRIANEIQKMLSAGSRYYSKDIIRSFISLDNLADSLIYHALYISKMPKVLHIAGTRAASWHQFMVEYFSFLGMSKADVRKSSYKDIDGKAPRPKRTPLNVNLALKLGVPLHDFKEDFK